MAAQLMTCTDIILQPFGHGAAANGAGAVQSVEVG